MDLSLLRTCLAVYRSGSLTKASRVLGISQPAVTGHLRALEAKLDQPLFVRTPEGAVPTAAAHELVRDTAAALDCLEGALWRRMEPEKLADRQVRLAGPSDLIADRVMPALTELILDGLRLRVSVGLTDDLLEEAVAGAHDLVIATRRPRHPGLVSTPLMDEEFAVVGGGKWVKLISSDQIDAIGPRALDDIPVIAYAESQPMIRRYWMTQFGHPPANPPQVTVPDLRAVLRAVRAGAGISVLPTYLCADDLASGAISILHHVDVLPLNTLFLVGRAGGTVTAALSAVRARLTAAARSWS